MKELVVTGLALTGLLVGLVWFCHGTIERCPECGSLVNTSDTSMGNDYKFCVNCGWCNAFQWGK